MLYHANVDGETLMAENHTDGIQTGESVPMSAIFHVIGSQGIGVVSTALQHRDAASESARTALNAALDNSKIQISGFRKPSRAQPDRLSDHVMLELLDGNDKLASAVLRVWAEARADLAHVVTEHLRGRGVPMLDSRRDRFHEVWPKNLCILEGTTLASEHGGFDRYDVTLMLCYLSGRFPEGDEMESELFGGWLNQLEAIPPNAPEWNEAPAFIAALIEMCTAKSGERDRALREEFDEVIAGIARQFEEELHYLSVDVSQAPAEVAARPDLIKPAHVLAGELRDALEAYREIRPQGATREEEVQRARERTEREEEIYGIVHAWEELLAVADQPEGPEAQAPDGPDAPAGITVGEHEALENEKRQLAVENEQLTQANDALQQTQTKLHAEKETLTAENARLSEENSALQHVNDKLRMEKDEERDENSRLKRELRESRQREEAWRGAPAPAQRPADAAEDNQPPIDSVRIAVTRTKSKFPDHLLIALNSRSNEDTPFQRPSEVYDALSWLASDYHRLRSSPSGTDPDFDKTLKEVCPGWSYVPHQSAVTIGMFKDWYYTTSGGAKYELNEHIGKGNSGNPQHTIRIAFAWDADLQKVIVGYVGLHQRNQGS